jgi:hypothetical protein
MSCSQLLWLWIGLGVLGWCEAFEYTSANDDPQQREALLALYTSTGGPTAWPIVPSGIAVTPWNSSNVSYCR